MEASDVLVKTLVGWNEAVDKKTAFTQWTAILEGGSENGGWTAAI
jgi:hypothetical protein